MENITIKLQKGVYMVRGNGRLLAITHSYAEAVKAVAFFEQHAAVTVEKQEVAEA